MTKSILFRTLLKIYILITIILVYITVSLARQPNIILFLTDDLGAGDLHCTGHPYIKSPNIDQFAKEGTVFEKGYMAATWHSRQAKRLTI